MYYVDIAVIQPGFTYIKFRGIYCSKDKKDAIGYWVWMQQFFRCHAILKVEGKDFSKQIEINPPEGQYSIPEVAA